MGVLILSNAGVKDEEPAKLRQQRRFDNELLFANEVQRTTYECRAVKHLCLYERVLYAPPLNFKTPEWVF